MTAPFYVAPEQVMADRADYARKGIARGRSLVSISCQEGILICAENPSHLLRKVAEIYDRIAFAGVGKYNEFDQLRIAGVRHADLKGFSYSREDVDARSLANQYAQILGNVFTHEMKPLEVEILVAEVAETPDEDRLFVVHYDGTLVDQNRYCVLGGAAESVDSRLSTLLGDVPDAAAGLAIAVAALAGPDRELAPADLEVAILERTAERRAFRRIDHAEVAEWLSHTPHVDAPQEPEASNDEGPASASTDAEPSEAAATEDASGSSEPDA